MTIRDVSILVQEFRGRRFERGVFDCWVFVGEFFKAAGRPFIDVPISEEIPCVVLSNIYRDWYKVHLSRAFDVILFKNKRGNIYHVGIIISNTKFIHNSGRGVILSEIENPIWQRRCVGIYRRND